MKITIVGDLEALGPFVTVVLVALLLFREFLSVSGRGTPLLRKILNVLIVPFLFLFILQIILFIRAQA